MCEAIANKCKKREKYFQNSGQIRRKRPEDNAVVLIFGEEFAIITGQRPLWLNK